MTETPARVTESLVRHIETLKAEIKQLERAICEHIDKHPGLQADQALLRTLPGVGEKTSKPMLRRFNRHRFDSAKAAAAFVG